MRVDYTEQPSLATVVEVNGEVILLLSTDIPIEVRGAVARVLAPLTARLDQLPLARSA
jgi:hypothetical protein